MDHLLIGEIKDACFHDLTRLEEGILSNNAIGFDPVQVLGQLDHIDAGIRTLNDDRLSHRWSDWPGASNPKDKPGTNEKALTKCINRIGQAVAKTLKQVDAPRKWTAKYCNTSVKHDRCHRKPDVVLMDAQAADSSDTSTGWDRIFAVGELKSGSSAGQTIEQLAHYARLIFGEQPDRMHVLGFGVHQDKLFYTLFNRAGVFTSDGFNVHKNPDRLIRVVAGMMFAGRETIGFDPTMKLTQFDETEEFECYIEVGENKYAIVGLLHVESVICGRATSVYKVKNPKAKQGDSDEFLVVKNGWVDSSRTKENETLAELADIPYIPRVVAHQVSQASTKTHFDEWTGQNPGTHLNVNEMAGRVERRKQVRVAITPVGTSIVDFRSLKELVHVFITIVDGEQRFDMIVGDRMLTDISDSN